MSASSSPSTPRSRGPTGCATPWRDTSRSNLQRMKPLYTARATVTGGRDQGHGRTDDGVLEVDLRMPKEMGGEGGGTNPEQLFAIGFASCFESALKVVARRQKVDADDVSVESAVTLTPTPERAFEL